MKRAQPYAHRQILKRAIDKATSMSALARELAVIADEPVSRQRIENWMRRDQYMPSEAIAWLSRYLGDASVARRLLPQIASALEA